MEMLSEKDIDSVLKLNRLCDLHSHISGSVPPETLFELALKKKVHKEELDRLTGPFGLELGTILTQHSREDALKVFKSAFVYDRKTHSNPTDRFKNILYRFPFINYVISTSEDRYRSAYDAARDAYEQGVSYLELRADPWSPVRAGNAKDPWQVLLDYVGGIKEANKDFKNFECNLTLCIAKQWHITKNGKPSQKRISQTRKGLERMTQLLAKNPSIKEHVLGLDAVNQEIVPLQHFKKIFEAGRKVGLVSVPHAGEAFRSFEEGISNIYAAVDCLKSKRVGHALAAVMNPEKVEDKKDDFGKVYTTKRIGKIINAQEELLDYIKEKNVAIELNPTANISVANIKCYEDHPIRKFMEKGTQVVVGTDDVAIFGKSLAEEIKSIVLAQKMDRKDLLKLLDNARINSLKSFKSA